MMNGRIRKALALGLTLGAGSLALAQEGNTTFFTGEHIVAGGASPLFTSFSPDAQDATTRMFNDGATAGDTSSTDHIWTRTLTNGSPTAGPTDIAKWKMGTWDGASSTTNWAHEAPHGGDAFYPTNAASVAFKWVDTAGNTNDGYLPNNDYVYTEPNNIGARMQAAATFKIWGNFGSELGGPGDWGASLNHFPLTRNTSNPSDVTWDITLSGWTSLGSKEFKAVMNDWGDGNEIGSNGLGGGNAKFTLLRTSDVITFKVRENDGRYKFVGLTPTPTTDGYYVLGPWTSTPETDSDMSAFPLGYQFWGTVPTAGNYKITIIHIVSGAVTETFPGQGAYPIHTTTNNQVVRINLHTASMGDGATPDNNFIVSDPDSRPNFTGGTGRVQIVGMLGMWGTRYGSDFENPATDTVASNPPVGTETGAGSGLYRWNAPTTDHGSATPLNKAYKAVGLSDHITTSGPWDIQFGGDSTSSTKVGLTVLGDNANPTFDFVNATDYSFFVDAPTGRVKVQLASEAAPTLRPAYADNHVGASVEGWTQY